LGVVGVMITKETDQKIAFAYREIETGEKLVADIKDTLSRHSAPDIRDAFGRRQNGLQLGVPSGEGGHRLFDVEWSLALPIIEAHIAKNRSIVAALSETARHEIGQ
jgi:hypothetical protein